MSKRAWTLGAIAVALVAALVLAWTFLVKKRDAQASDVGVSDADDDVKGKRKRGKRRGKGKRGRKSAGDLESLGYLSVAEAREEDRHKSGTVRHDEAKVQPGMTLVVPASAQLPGQERLKEAMLVDMNGATRHKWSGDPFTQRASWVIARVDDEGYLYALSMLSGMVKLDWESNVVWGFPGRFHHDFAFTSDGIVALVARGRDVPSPGRPGQQVSVRDNGVMWLDRDGLMKRVIWFSDVLADDPDLIASLREKVAARERAGREGMIDIFHANAVELLPRDVEGLGEKGDILTSIRNLDFVVVIDNDTETVKWKWGRGELQHQHDPHLNAAGNIVVFDNGIERGRSRVLEVTPAKQIAWAFDGGDEAFFSTNRGMSQPLPNGNVLISISNEAKLLEVTPAREVVWDYFSPRRHRGGRYPIRAIRISGTPFDTVQAILAGTREPPRTQPGAAVVVPAQPDPTEEDPEVHASEGG